jgi:hypothetical protein
MHTPRSILAQLRPLSGVNGFDEAEATLSDPATRVSEPTNLRFTVKRLNFVWGARLKIFQDKGLPAIPGCEGLVQSLARFPEETILKRVALRGVSTLGAVWFVEATDEPVGFVFWQIAAR